MSEISGAELVWRMRRVPNHENAHAILNHLDELHATIRELKEQRADAVMERIAIASELDHAVIDGDLAVQVRSALHFREEAIFALRSRLDAIEVASKCGRAQ